MLLHSLLFISVYKVEDDTSTGECDASNCKDDVHHCDCRVYHDRSIPWNTIIGNQIIWRKEGGDLNLNGGGGGGGGGGRRVNGGGGGGGGGEREEEGGERMGEGEGEGKGRSGEGIR